MKSFHPACWYWLTSLAVLPAFSAQPWPAESPDEATHLTAIDADLDTGNWSGAFWNPVTRTLWLANNSGYFWALAEDGQDGFRVATDAAGEQAKWSPGGDLESICQADDRQNVVYLLDENGWIRAYDVTSYGVAREIQSWNIQAQCPEIKGQGPEGLTFVPNEWLARRNFQGPDGTPCRSTNGMDGLMLVGHQIGGAIHLFDLQPHTHEFDYLGKLKTGRQETAALEFDRVSGVLYIWHNIAGNYLELSDLSSEPDGPDRRLKALIEYQGPRQGNLEGFALAPGLGTTGWCVLTDDDNDDGEAVMGYRHFPFYTNGNEKVDR